MFLGKTLNFHSAYPQPEQTISEARRNAGEAWKGNGKHPVQERKGVNLHIPPQNEIFLDGIFNQPCLAIVVTESSL